MFLWWRYNWSHRCKTLLIITVATSSLWYTPPDCVHPYILHHFNCSRTTKVVLNFQLLINLPCSPFACKYESSIKSAFSQSWAISWPQSLLNHFHINKEQTKCLHSGHANEGCKAIIWKSKYFTQQYILLSNFPPRWPVSTEVINWQHITKNNNEALSILRSICNQPFVRSRRLKLKRKTFVRQNPQKGRQDPPLPSRLSSCYQKQPAAFSVRSRRLTHKHRHSPTACHAC